MTFVMIIIAACVWGTFLAINFGVVPELKRIANALEKSPARSNGHPEHKH